MDTTTSPRETQKNPNPIEALSKDEIIGKYKGLLNIAKKAKQAKDELTEENRLLKEALKRAAEKQSSLPALQEMVQEFTEKNLILTEQVNALKRKTKEDSDRLEQFEIENESLKRQLGRLSDENDDLLADVDRMEKAMQQVNALGNEQRKNLELLEVDIAKFKEAEAENSRLRDQLVTVNEESTLLQQKYQSLKELNSEQRKKFNSLKDRFIDVHRKLKNLKECKCVLLETQHEYAASVSKWQADIIKASQLLCGKMSSLQAENEQLKQDTEKADNSRKNKEDSLDRKRLLLRIKDLERLSKTIKQTQEQQRVNVDVQHLLDKLTAIEKLAGVVKEQQRADQENLAVVTRERQKNDNHSSNLDVSLFRAKLTQMQGLVQVIEKERSNQQIKLQDLEAICIELRQHNEDLLTRFHLKEQEHSELLSEMRELNEALKGRGDAISRLQEQHEAEVKRQQELETQLSGSQQATLEKLQIIEQLQSRVDELEQANADAQSDVLSTSTISRAEELSRLRELDEGYEEKYHKLRALAAKLKKKLQEQTQQLKEMDQGGAINQEALKLAQAQLQQDLNAARAENQRLKSKEKAKHSSVLNLEIEAAEKSLADVSAKLTAKSSELEAVRESLASKENTIVQLRKEIAILEEAKNGEAAHSQQLKEQIDRMQVQVKDAVHSKQLALTATKDLEQGVEKAKAEAEQLRLQLAESAQQYESRLSKSTDLLTSRTAELETQLASEKQLKLALRNAERAHEDLQMEYTEYKLKAQAVLRKNQNKGTKEQELEDELSALRESEGKLRASNEGRAARLAQLDGQLEALHQDNAELQKRSRELLALVDELRQKNDLLTLENQRQLQFEHDLMQQHRQEIDKIDAGHREQLKQMQQKLEELQQSQQLNVSQRSNASAVSGGEPSPEQAKIDYLLMDHETNLDGVPGGDISLAQLAAQRKISTASRRSHDFMPLDELLNTSMNQITSDTVTTISNFGRSVSQQEDDEAELAANGDFAVQNAQLQATKERLGIQESRVKHLTSLLAENEQDLAKLTQMNDMLKEELRRQERSEEREQHMHNSEYLKNVFLKFLTLNNADERQRLVPVLNTILRLSRHEMEMLNCVAKGQKVSTDGSSRGWTGFLTAWGGGGGGGGSNNNN